MGMLSLSTSHWHVLLVEDEGWFPSSEACSSSRPFKGTCCHFPGFSGGKRRQKEGVGSTAMNSMRLVQNTSTDAFTLLLSDNLSTDLDHSSLDNLKSFASSILVDKYTVNQPFGGALLQGEKADGSVSRCKHET